MLIFFNRNMNTASVNRVLSEMINCYGPMGMTNFALRRPVESKPLDQSKIDTIDYIAEVCPFAKFGKKNRFGGGFWETHKTNNNSERVHRVPYRRNRYLTYPSLLK